MYAQRPTKVSPIVYIHNRFYHSSRHFAQSVPYVMHMVNYQDMKAISGAVSFQMRKTSKQKGHAVQLKILGADVLPSLMNEDPQLDEHFSSFFPLLRGHRDYWRQQSLNIQSMCE
jgi:hypothetical protein